MHTIKQTQGGPYPSIYKPTSWRLASAADGVIPRLENFTTGHGVLTNGCHQLAGKRREPPWRCTIVDVKRVAHPPEGRATRLTAGSSSYLDSCWWIKVSQNSHGALPSEPRPPELRPVASFAENSHADETKRHTHIRSDSVGFTGLCSLELLHNVVNTS